MQQANFELDYADPEIITDKDIENLVQRFSEL